MLLQVVMLTVSSKSTHLGQMHQEQPRVGIIIILFYFIGIIIIIIIIIINK
jgi:hypothetical protein